MKLNVKDGERLGEEAYSRFYDGVLAAPASHS